MKIAVKLTVTFFAIAAIAVLVTSVVTFMKGRKTLEQESFNKLTAVREMKASQITGYFDQIRDQLISLSEEPSVVEAMKGFKSGFRSVASELKADDKRIGRAEGAINRYIDSSFVPQLKKNNITDIDSRSIFSKEKNALLLQDFFIASNPNPLGEKHELDTIPARCTYNSVHKKIHPSIRSFLKRFGYYDIFMIDNETGDVVYTVYKETDFASNLNNGPFSKTNFAECYRRALNIRTREEARLVDFAAYLPSYNAHASFIAAPIFENGKIIGVLAFQMPIDNINNIMTNNKEWYKVGLGHTGETYIVGEDYTLRNQSRFLIEDSANYFKMLSSIGTHPEIIARIRNFNSSVGLQEVRTEGTEEALKGNSNTLIFKDYRGVPVLSAFKPLYILGMNWVIMSEIDEEEAFAPIDEMRNTTVKAFAAVLLLILIVSVIVSRQITRPLKELEYDAIELAKGHLDVELTIKRKDEIGSLANSFRKMQAALSELIHGLEDKVKERTEEVVKQRDIILHKQSEIMDSLNYAKRIQHTLLASEKFLNKYLPNHFLMFKPKDIVSGDFYWATKNDSRFYLAVCDSTGHGVPGAFMSLLNIAFLNEAINQKHIVEPNEILNHVRERLIKNLSKDGRQDGMDGILLSIDLKTKKIHYAAAHNAPVMIREGELLEFEADKMPVGKGVRDESFKLYHIDSQPGDTIILYTDGYADQFGGPRGKKLMYKPLKEKLKTYNHMDLSEQKAHLDSFFEEWKGEMEQVDDVCMIGIRV